MTRIKHIKTTEIIWLTLIILTILALFLGKVQSPIFIGVLLFSTALKAVLVSEYFMGLKNVKMKYRMIPLVWLFIVLGLIGVAYFL